LIRARRTWAIIDDLLERGFTKQQIATWLGSKAKVPALQIKRTHVKASTAVKVERMAALLKAGKLRRG
jgi:hypothetical protein